MSSGIFCYLCLLWSRQKISQSRDDQKLLWYMSLIRVVYSFISSNLYLKSPGLLGLFYLHSIHFMSFTYNLNHLENRLISAYALLDDYCDDFVLRRSEVAGFIAASDNLLKRISKNTNNILPDDNPEVIRRVLRDQLFDYLTYFDLMKFNRTQDVDIFVSELSLLLSGMLDSRQLTWFFFIVIIA